MPNKDYKDHHIDGLADNKPAQPVACDAAFERKMEMRRKRRWRELMTKLELI